MYTYYPYYWGRPARWWGLLLIQYIDPQFEAFLKAGAARIVVPARLGFEGALAHYQSNPPRRCDGHRSVVNLEGPQ